jgi:hypothetical protein
MCQRHATNGLSTCVIDSYIKLLAGVIDAGEEYFGYLLYQGTVFSRLSSYRECPITRDRKQKLPLSNIFL